MNLRVSLMLLLALVLSLLFASMASAAPSFFGYTGLIRVPTADALDYKDYNLALFTLQFKDETDSNNWIANMGISERLEVGFTRVDPDDGSSETWINAKYTFQPERNGNPAFAVGLIDFTDESDTTGYVVMTTTIGDTLSTAWGEVTSPQVHIGAGGGQFNGVFAGVSAIVGQRLMLMLEHDSDAINFGARLAVTPEIRVHFGVLDNIDQIGIGVSFNKWM